MINLHLATLQKWLILLMQNVKLDNIIFPQLTRLQNAIFYSIIVMVSFDPELGVNEGQTFSAIFTLTSAPAEDFSFTVTNTIPGKCTAIY